MTTPPSQHLHKLGQVTLLAHGTTKTPELLAALKDLIARSKTLNGWLIIGYPKDVTAALISEHGQITAVDLDPNVPATGYQDRQDAAYNALHRQLILDHTLTLRRQLKQEPSTLTICAGVQTTNPGHPEHPLVHMAQAMAKLEELQTATVPGIDPQRVIDRTLLISSIS